MSEYTAEQVAREADLQEDHVADMLRDYAALLRELEPAKAVVTDELAERVLNRYVNECISHLDEAPVHLRVTAMRTVLEAVAPMLASARVTESLEVAGYVDPDQVRSTQQAGGSVGIGSFSSRYGRTVPVYWDGAAAPKPTNVWPVDAREKAFSLAREMLQKGSAKPETEE